MPGLLIYHNITKYRTTHYNAIAIYLSSEHYSAPVQYLAIMFYISNPEVASIIMHMTRGVEILKFSTCPGTSK